MHRRWNKQQWLEAFSGGNAIHAQEILGAHRTASGFCFRVWAPHAVAVSVVGAFFDEKYREYPMQPYGGGIWETEIANVQLGDCYQYLLTDTAGQRLYKADPYAYAAELRPGTASRAWDLEPFSWHDAEWLQYRREHKVYHAPLNIYEVHAGSWRRHPDGSVLTYLELAEALIPYVKDLGFTHIELLPLTEHPLDASWGYQCTGYFAATARYGTPEMLMTFVDRCHQAGIGVIMDWVPAHFPKDAHGLGNFDGKACYEHWSPLMREHPEWGTYVFDYGKGEVQSFLISSALFWLEVFHMDGIRVDAVASMLYLDYARPGGNWLRNRYGGRENLEAVAFLQKLNRTVFGFDDSILMIAEESTAWPGVTTPVYAGGLGFNLKWNMGWMHDILHYIQADPCFRAGRHKDLTFPLFYAFSENFILPISHDEVVHLKGALFQKFPGTTKQQCSSLRLFWTYMLAHPGKKLLFMGAELGQDTEWDFAGTLPWNRLKHAGAEQLRRFFREAGRFYLRNPPLWEEDFDAEGFEWLCPDEKERNILGFLRRDTAGNPLLFLCNFSGVVVEQFALGVPQKGFYRTVFSTDAQRFGGSGLLREGSIFSTQKLLRHGRTQAIVLDLPPLSAALFRPESWATPFGKEKDG